MATSGRGTGTVGNNVQTAVDTSCHLIVAHEVTNVAHDRTQLASMTRHVQQTLGRDALTVIADRGYFTYGGIQTFSLSFLVLQHQ